METGYDGNVQRIENLKSLYPEKFVSEDKIFSHINRGNRLFIGGACGEPQYLVRALINYVESNPKAFFDAEVFNVWTLAWYCTLCRRKI
jgi:acyl-CoA hydrolase